ncbi:MAG: YicC family protein [Gemmatimonadetes bacterium]|nr:YicC family protein [Gemmatimonadota bacterium]
MIRSMTGYGEAERESPAGRLRLEVKTVNHRFFNTSIKTPSGFDKFEREIAEALKRHLSRGHVSAFLTIDRSATESGTARQIDLDRARQIRASLESLRSELGVPGEVDLGMLARFDDLFRAPEQDRTEGVDAELVRSLAEDAGRSVRSLREAEGARLRADLEGRLSAMAEALDRVETRAPERLVTERDRLREAVKELSEQVPVDEDRLAREIAYLAERWDINEELVRLRSHIGLFQEALSADGEEPVGKRLGFLVQEMHREVNTIGSKANDSEISHDSVRLKEEVERIREQVENIE